MLPAEPPAPTPLYHGNGDPLWVAWARPFRNKKYLEKTDIIYLAREDGAIIHIEIDAAELLPSVTNVGCLEANIDTAFTSAYDIFADVLMIGGDSGPGGIWKVSIRQTIVLVLRTVFNDGPLLIFSSLPARTSSRSASSPTGLPLLI